MIDILSMPSLMKTGERKLKKRLFVICLSWVIFGLAVYLAYSENWRRRIDYGASLFGCLASTAYLTALIASIDYKRTKRLRDFAILWVIVGVLSLIFAATGYFIEQSVYTNADDPEKSDGGLILFIAFAVGIIVALISSLSIAANRAIDKYGEDCPRSKR
jgi:hypothetical protein